LCLGKRVELELLASGAGDLAIERGQCLDNLFPPRGRGRQFHGGD